VIDSVVPLAQSAETGNPRLYDGWWIRLPGGALNAELAEMALAD
jgi:hypothetical protein